MILQAQILNRDESIAAHENRECSTPEEAAALRRDFEHFADWQDVRVVSACGALAVHVPQRDSTDEDAEQ